jgi:hypothetical protein
MSVKVLGTVRCLTIERGRKLENGSREMLARNQIYRVKQDGLAVDRRTMRFEEKLQFVSVSATVRIYTKTPEAHQFSFHSVRPRCLSSISLPLPHCGPKKHSGPFEDMPSLVFFYILCHFNT